MFRFGKNKENMNEVKVIGFTGLETEFEFVAKINGIWEEFKASHTPKYTYDRIEDRYYFKLESAICSQYSEKSEKYIPYTLSKDELAILHSAMNDCIDWDEVTDWADNFYNRD